MPRRNSGKMRKVKQEARRAYSIEREDQQLSGAQPTTPEGAVHQERRINPYDAPMPELVRLAIARGWDVSEEGKRKCVEDLVAAVSDPDTRESLRIRCFQALLLADKVEQERRAMLGES